MKIITAKTFTNSLFLAVVLTACGGKPVAPASDLPEVNQLSQQTVNAVLWYNTSAENEYIYEQTYNIAKMMVENNMQGQNDNRPRAVIVDVDETVLDNSPYQIELIKRGEVFSEESWAKWVLSMSCKALPGAVSFGAFCEERGIEIFYISNRSDRYLESTMQNLNRVKMPFADESHVKLRGDSSDKSVRRRDIESQYRVILYMGDNLVDFDNTFSDRSMMYGKQEVRGKLEEMLPRFLLFPNPMYGNWEGAFRTDDKLSPSERAKLKIEGLTEYDY